LKQKNQDQNDERKSIEIISLSQKMPGLNSLSNLKEKIMNLNNTVPINSF